MTTKAFQDAVYLTVADIPAGKVTSYGAIARRIGYPNHARQIGRVLRQLPADSTLPWHRVIRQDGTAPLGHAQMTRLKAEGVTFREQRVAQHHWY